MCITMQYVTQLYYNVPFRFQNFGISQHKYDELTLAFNSNGEVTGSMQPLSSCVAFPNVWSSWDCLSDTKKRFNKRFSNTKYSVRSFSANIENPIIYERKLCALM